LAECPGLTSRFLPTKNNPAGLVDDSSGDPGDSTGIADGKPGPLCRSFASNRGDAGDTGDIEQAEDHKGEGNQRRPAQLRYQSAT